MARFYIWNFYIGHEGYKDGYDGWHDGPNSAGGFSLKWDFKNCTGKTIKYAHFWATPYNAVDDPVKCTVTGESTDGVRFTGPLANGETYTGCLWENAWYNHTIKTARMEKVYIEYMDGTDEHIYAKDIEFSNPNSGGSSPSNSGSNSNSGCGCYVATAVYGSYDCPQVWTLRRYRDDVLAETWFGRLFVKTYYAISPTLVKWFGKTEWFKKMWRGPLDKMVQKLQDKGVESTPYEDKQW